MFTYLKMFFSLMIAASHGPGTAGTIGDTSRLSSPFFSFIYFFIGTTRHLTRNRIFLLHFLSFPILYLTCIYAYFLSFCKHNLPVHDDPSMTIPGHSPESTSVMVSGGLGLLRPEPATSLPAASLVSPQEPTYVNL